MRVYTYDYVAVIVAIGSVPTLTVAQIIRLRGANEAVQRQSDVGISVEELISVKSCLTVRPMKSTPMKDILYFSGEASDKEFSVSGAFTNVIQFDIKDNELTLPITFLDEMKSIIISRISDPEAPLFKFIHKGGHQLRHFDSAGNILFASEVITKDETDRICPFPQCLKAIPNEKFALNHFCYHFIENHFPQEHELCPLCFGPVALCEVYLESGQPRVVCAMYTPTSNAFNLGYSLKFSMAPMKKISASSPCTNHPIVCPVCHPDLADKSHCIDTEGPVSRKKKVLKRPAVWKYNMRLHFKQKHTGCPIPPGLETDISISTTEKQILLETKGLSRYNQAIV